MKEGCSGYYKVSVSSEEPLLTQAYVLAYDWNIEPTLDYNTIYTLVDGVVEQVGMVKRSAIYREDGLVYIFWDNETYVHGGTTPKSDIKVTDKPSNKELTMKATDKPNNKELTMKATDNPNNKELTMKATDKQPPYGEKLSEVLYNLYSYYVRDCGEDMLDLWQVMDNLTSPTLLYFSKVSRYEVRFTGATAKVDDPSKPTSKSTVDPTEIWCDTLFDSKVLNWAEERNLLAGGTVTGQFQKLVEELGELARALARNDVWEAKDAIGDMDVVLTILSKQLGVTRSKCREAAYNEIKNRKGTMCGGVFIKD